MNRKIIMIALVLIVIGVVGAVVTGKEYFAYEEVGGEEQISAENLEEMSILSDVANLHIKPSMDNDLHVKWSGKVGIGNDSVVETKIKDRKLIVDIKNKSFFNFINWNWHYYSVEIYIPRKELNKLTVSNNVGIVVADHIEVQTIDVETDVSDIKIKSVKSNSIIVSSAVGKISINNSKGEIVANNDIGTIHIVVPEITGHITAKTDVGEIKLQTQKDQNKASIFGASDLGSIKIFNHKDQKYLVEGSEYLIDLKTDIGDITVSEIK